MEDQSFLNEALMEIIENNCSRDFISQYHSAIIAQNFNRQEDGVSWTPLRLQTNTLLKVYDTFKSTKGRLTKEPSQQSKQQQSQFHQQSLPIAPFTQQNNKQKRQPPMCIICLSKFPTREISARHYLVECPTIKFNQNESDYRSKCRDLISDQEFEKLFNSLNGKKSVYDRSKDGLNSENQSRNSPAQHSSQQKQQSTESSKRSSYSTQQNFDSDCPEYKQKGTCTYYSRTNRPCLYLNHKFDVQSAQNQTDSQNKSSSSHYSRKKPTFNPPAGHTKNDCVSYLKTGNCTFQTKHRKPCPYNHINTIQSFKTGAAKTSSTLNSGNDKVSKAFCAFMCDEKNKYSHGTWACLKYPMKSLTYDAFCNILQTNNPKEFEKYQKEEKLHSIFTNCMVEALKLDAGRKQLQPNTHQTGTLNTNYLSFQSTNQGDSFLGQSSYTLPER
jgi:hypothetical protein